MTEINVCSEPGLKILFNCFYFVPYTQQTKRLFSVKKISIVNHDIYDYLNAGTDTMEVVIMHFYLDKSQAHNYIVF